MRKAGLFARLIAFIIDGFILSLFAGLITFIISLISDIDLTLSNEHFTLVSENRNNSSCGYTYLFRIPILWFSVGNIRKNYRNEYI